MRALHSVALKVYLVVDSHPVYLSQTVDNRMSLGPHGGRGVGIPGPA